MRIFPRLGVLCTFLVASAFGCLSVAIAQQQPNMIATPFIAAESPDSKSFLSSVVSTGKRNPFLVSTNSSGVRQGTYPGVILSSQDANTSFSGLDELSFSYKGPASIEAMLEYTAPGRPMQKSFATFHPNSAAKGDFTTVVLKREQLAIPKNSSLNKVVLTPKTPAKKGHFLVDNIELNGNPVGKAMETLFFGVVGGSPTGPLASAATTGTGTASILTITNAYPQPVTFFMQLQPIAGCTAATDVQAVFPTMSYVYSGNTTLGYVVLSAISQGGTTLTSSYTGPLSANFSVGAFNQLCPTNLFKNGVNLAETTLNNSCQGANAQETLDISLVNGLNAVFRWTVGGTKFSTVTNSAGKPTPTVVYTSKFENSPNFNGNFKLAGVFPYGCTNCTNNAGVSTCPSPGFPQPPATSWNQNPRPYGACNAATFLGCNFSRNASSSGGSIQCTYQRPSN